MLNIKNEKFNRLTALKSTNKSIDGKIIWKFICDCGNIVLLPASRVKRGQTKSCGCLWKESISLKEGIAAFNKIFLDYKFGAKKRNLYFGLSKKQFKLLIDSTCHYCGRSPSKISSTKNGIYLYNGIDRKNNSKGYIKNNCLSCCTKCNVSKGTMSYSEFKEYIKTVYNFMYGII